MNNHLCMCVGGYVLVFWTCTTILGHLSHLVCQMGGCCTQSHTLFAQFKCPSFSSALKMFTFEPCWSHCHVDSCSLSATSNSSLTNSYLIWTSKRDKGMHILVFIVIFFINVGNFYQKQCRTQKGWSCINPVCHLTGWSSVWQYVFCISRTMNFADFAVVLWHKGSKVWLLWERSVKYYSCLAQFL